jgi:hypothetical protein
VDFEIKKPQHPIAVGEIAEYAVIISNKGTKAAEGIEIAAYFEPNAIEPFAVEGDAINKANINSEQSEVIFTPIPVLAEGHSLKYIIKVKGLTSGNHKMHVALVCQSTKTSLSKQQTSYYYQGKNKGLSNMNPETGFAKAPMMPTVPAINNINNSVLTPVTPSQYPQSVMPAATPKNTENIPMLENSNGNPQHRTSVTPTNPLFNRNHEETQVATSHQVLPSDKLSKNMPSESLSTFPSFGNNPNGTFTPQIPNTPSSTPILRSTNSAPRQLITPRAGNSTFPTPPALNDALVN